MDNNANQVLSSARSILVVLPTSPRLDVAAAGISFALSFQKTGKITSVVCATPMTVELSRLVGVEKVSDRLGDKNLLVRFNGYDASGIDTVTYNVDNNQFELVVATKDGAVPPSLGQVQLSYRGLSADVVILVGSPDPDQYGKLNSQEIFQSGRLAYIGNLAVPESLPLLFSLGDPSATSLSEIVAKFLDGQQILEQDSASNLLFGIETVTNNFQSQATSASSFETAAICLRHGAQRHSQEVREIRANQQNQWRGRPDQRGPRPSRPYAPQTPVSPTPQPPESPLSPTQQPASQPAAVPPPQQTAPASVPMVPEGLPTKQEPPSPEWLEPKIYTGRTLA